MAEALRDLLGLSPAADRSDLKYLEHLAGQPIDALLSSEPQQLSQSSQSLLRSVQSLSKKSHKGMVDSAIGHSSLKETVPSLATKTTELGRAVPRLDAQAEQFSTQFSKSGENPIIVSRKQTLRLLQNSERLVDLMELPPLLLSAVNASPLGYSSTLDLYSHIRRLDSLYPDSKLVSNVLKEADEAIRKLALDLIAALKTPNVKLAGALRNVGWLKRMVPDLVADMAADDSLQAVFLICRFSNLLDTLEALDPLRQLADDERQRQNKAGQSWSGGQQTERYLKRYIEVFREHSFNIISISKNIGGGPSGPSNTELDPLATTPPALSTFPLHLVGMLLDTLRAYLPTVKDQTSRESIITQVLYCAGSLGRLGADFSMLLATVGVDAWVDVVKRHRLMAGRLESAIGDHRSATPSATPSASA